MLKILSSAVNYTFYFYSLHRTWFWGSVIIIGFIVGIIVASYQNDKAEEVEEKEFFENNF